METPAEWDDMREDVRAIADMQFASFNHYVVERFGISTRTARNLLKLVRSFLSLPLIEKAFQDGVLTQERALLLLKVVTEKTEREWLKYGTEVSVLDQEHEERRLKEA
ncbi:MAG: hypothetical protein AB2L14_00285 [Candidatus Xenobiia bacterium LiM19]